MLIKTDAAALLLHSASLNPANRPDHSDAAVAVGSTDSAAVAEPAVAVVVAVDDVA